MVAFLGGLFSSMSSPNMRAMMLNVNTPETRGVATALQSTTDDLGKGLGPVFVAAFISSLGRRWVTGGGLQVGGKWGWEG